MEELINLITQNGIGVICVAFLMYFINTTSKENTKVLGEILQTLASINANMTTLSNRVDKLEDIINKLTSLTSRIVNLEDKIGKKKTKKEEEK